jgi:hypothetical protein
VKPVWQHFSFVFNRRVHDDVRKWLNTHLNPSRHLLFGSIYSLVYVVTYIEINITLRIKYLIGKLLLYRSETS